MSTPSSFFITGTDTDSGKTLFACAMLEKARQCGLSTSALKPVAAGAEPDPENGLQLRNDDAVSLARHMSLPLPYAELNPIVFAEAIAPHLAAKHSGSEISLPELLNLSAPAFKQGADLTLVEGAGGWLVPLNSQDTLADYAQGLYQQYGTQAILVVRIKLGCINHALMTVQAIENSGVPLAGWVANILDTDVPFQDENISTLRERIKAPCLGVIPNMVSPTGTTVENIAGQAAEHIKLDALNLVSGVNAATEIAANSDYKEWLDYDLAHLWHPYTSTRQPLPCYPVASAKGCYLNLASGETLLDGMSSWWAAIHGYNHPRLNQAITDQLQSMAHVMFGGLSHEPAAKLGRSLLELGPPNMEHVFLADSGSVSVEVAIKMAAQYYQAKNRPDKTRLLALRNGYHGDTAGAMAACDPVTGMHSLFSKLLPQHIFAPQPGCRFGDEWDPESFKTTRELLEKNHQELCAVIVEPIVQGAGGIWFYHPQFLTELRQVCNELDILLIFDEIATGFGRSGKMFAWEWAGAAPDIITVGKALTGGYMTLAATCCSAEVANTISSAGPLMHGPTFMGNPLACAVANASLELLTEMDWEAKVADLQYNLNLGLEACIDLAAVKDVRTLGGIGAIELHEDVDIAAAQEFFVAQGVWIRPFGKLIYLMPPYCSTAAQLGKLTTAISDYAYSLS